MTTHNKHNHTVWQDALDDGSLTLRAEHLLLRLPSHAVPALSCLFYPELVNRLAHNMGSALNSSATDFAAELFVQLGYVFSKVEHLNTSQLESTTFEEIEDEWLKLRGWLRAELAKSEIDQEEDYLASA